MAGAHRRIFFILFFLSAVVYIHAQQPFEMASLRPAKELIWQRTSPSAEKPDGPVLYQILFRSSAHIGSIPKIGPTYTLVDSGLLLDNSGNLVIGGLTINGSTGVVTFPTQQSSGNSTQDFWSLGGNTGTAAGANYIGTNDNQPFEVHVGNNGRVLRIEPQIGDANSPAPNVIGGFSGNTVTNNAFGATIAGGGEQSSSNRVGGNFGTVSGGNLNTAGGTYSTVAGGTSNVASGGDSTVAGGLSNTASGVYSTVAGGIGNNASGGDSTVGGGVGNQALGSDSTVAGGHNNVAYGQYSFIAGGFLNATGKIGFPDTSGKGAFAAGQYATADQDGCFVWGDNSTTTSTTCGAVNRFVVRAAGGALFSNGVRVDISDSDNGTPSNTTNSANLLLLGGGVPGEGIGSQRTSNGGGNGNNQFGLDFYTNYRNRMFIDNGGNVHVVNNLTKGGGSFQIDHPLDPANKYLSHSFVESPDMMNIYNGNAVLDNRGQAWVNLPNWFEALNMDFRYQLTPIGNPGRHILYIAQEIANNRFQIAGGRPGARVSWQVTGIRHDAYANAHRIQVEEDKGDKRGTYLHPELFKTSAVAAGGRP